MSAFGARTRSLRALILVLALLGASSRASAQESGPRLQPEVRAAVLVESTTGVHASLGASVPAGIYVRIGAAIGADLIRERGGARADVVARFLLDPFMQFAHAPYAGAGLSVRDERGRARPYLLLALGAEGRAHHGLVPAAELSLGGGLRAGLVLRRAMRGRR